MPKLKLQVRIALLIFGLSLLFVCVFTYIQVRNEVDKLRDYNKYRARVGTIIVKTSIETLLEKIQGPDELRTILEAVTDSFTRENIAEKISVISTDGTVVATNDPMVMEFGEAKNDIDTYVRLSKMVGSDAWFYSTVNEKTEMTDIYIPLYTGTGATYIAKLSFSIGNVRRAVANIIFPIVLTILAIAMGNILLGFILMKTIATPIKILNTATKDIASGNLDLRVSINTRDEIEELGGTFNDMVAALKKMKEKAEGANPLTKLPGNNMIREEVDGRIRRGTKFVAVHADLDNFKAYNDKYGIAKGDEIIKFTSRLIQDAIRDKGALSDFVGHEGGDDFFYITTCEGAEAVANEVIKRFDTGIVDFYEDNDRQAGYIVEKDRKGNLLQFPIMTISLAGVTNQFMSISNYAELANMAVEIKRKLKTEQKSNFLVERRASSKE